MSRPSFEEARDHLYATITDPIIEMARAAEDEIREADNRVIRAENALEQLRPVWAQGFTDDSMAAQASATAMSEMWSALGVDNQTAAMERIRMLTHLERGGEVVDHE